MDNNSISLKDIIAPAFYEVFWDILDEKHTYYDLYGGRGSTKSSFVGVMIPFLMMQDAENDVVSNAVIFRKVGNTLRGSVYEQIAWGIDALGVNDLWDTSVSPMQYTYKPTGQKIIFRGLDKAKKTKSIKASKGYFKYLWFEELDEFSGIEEIRTVQQSVLRGGSKLNGLVNNSLMMRSILKRQIQEPISMNILDYLSDSVQISLSCWKSERFQTKKFRSIKVSIRDKTGDGIQIPKRLFVWLMYLIRTKLSCWMSLADVKFEIQQWLAR